VDVSDISGTESTWNNAAPFQIFTVDNGGLKGLFPAAILAAVEDPATVERMIVLARTRRASA
jgi:hypothetical protein